jgi:hypothetical protein
MDSTVGSGHRPAVVVGATMHAWVNRAVWGGQRPDPANNGPSGSIEHPVLLRKRHIYRIAREIQRVRPDHSQAVDSESPP